MEQDLDKVQIIVKREEKLGSVFAKQNQENFLSFSPGFKKFECNTTSDWLNRRV